MRGKLRDSWGVVHLRDRVTYTALWALCERGLVGFGCLEPVCKETVVTCLQCITLLFDST